MALFASLIFLFSMGEGFPKDKDITLVAVGDILPAHRMEPFIEESGPAYPYQFTLSLLKSADITFANLECPVSTKGKPVEGKEFTFCAKPPVVKGLKEAGFDVLSLANNHILDYGKEALMDTIKLLQDNRILSVGAGRNIQEARKPAVLKKGNRTFGFLAYSNTLPKNYWAKKDRTGTAYGAVAWVREDVRNLKEKADFIIVSFHWGGEGESFPKEYQALLAHQAIDSGADIVLGHHPHVLNGIEMYGGGVILYSLGNYAFGSYGKAEVSALFRFSFSSGKLKELEIIPLSVYNREVHFQPRVLENKQAKKVLEDIQDLSREFGTRIDIINSKGIIRF